MDETMPIPVTTTRRIVVISLVYLPAHDLFRKPVAIPDQVEDMLFGIMRWRSNGFWTGVPRRPAVRLAGGLGDASA
jgi:anti-sigma factor ChrR (cupin superfamily)